jgi:hypothetical protein
MLKNIKPVLKYFIVTLAAVIITFISQSAAFYGHPHVTQPSFKDICNTTAFYKPSLPPRHDSGLPLPYITNYVSDGGCGVGRPITWYLFILDCIIWFVIILGFQKIISRAKKR